MYFIPISFSHPLDEEILVPYEELSYPPPSTHYQPDAHHDDLPYEEPAYPSPPTHYQPDTHQGYSEPQYPEYHPPTYHAQAPDYPSQPSYHDAAPGYYHQYPAAPPDHGYPPPPAYLDPYSSASQPYGYPPHPYQSHLGDDPHFAVLLPSRMFLCYSVQGEPDHVFNLISNRDLHINALFVPDPKREEVTWIGGLGIVSHPSNGGNVTFVSFTTKNSSVTITSHLRIGGNSFLKTISMKAKHVASITLVKDDIHIKQHMSLSDKPTVNVVLGDVKLDFTVKFDNLHLDMFWHNVGVQARSSHGLIGQFFRPGVALDTVRKMLIMPHKEPVPIMRRPIWSFMERKQEREEDEEKFCWTSMNTGVQGHGLIDGHYLNYIVSDLLSTGFSPAKVHRRGRV